MSSTSSPPLRIGIISDIQYCDQDNRIDYSKKYLRRYRQSLETLREASHVFEQSKTDFNIALGDIVDMSSKKLAKGPSECLQEVIGAMNNQEFHFVLGNHDHECFSRTDILAQYKFGSNPTISSSLTEDKMYYSFSPIPSIRCIFLHSYDITTNGEPTHSDRYQKAAQLMLAHNPTVDPITLSSSSTADEVSHYAKYNGGMSDVQLTWLESQLLEAVTAQQQCLLFAHVSAHKRCTKPDSVVFNYEEVLSLIQRFPHVIGYIW
jgi:manganese-dependent ADP-ribose/CDP-alcohol diphosphatase